MNPWLLLFPLLAAVMGWLIHSLLLKILFHPRYPVGLPGIRFQGLIPKHRQAIAESLAKLVTEELFLVEMFEQKMADPGNMERILPLIEQHVDHFLRVKLGQEMPMINMFIGDKTIATMKKIFMQELETLFPEVMKSYAGNLRSGLQAEELIVDKIMAFSLDSMESVFNRRLARQLVFIKGAGAAAGFIIGLMLILLTLVIH